VSEKIIANRYKLLEQKSQDNICTIYEAQDQTDNKTVTIKVFFEKVTHMSLERLLRFKREIERVSKATHDNLLKIYEYGEYEGQHYLVTEHVNGAQSVTDYLKQAPEVDKAAGIMLQVCAGLAKAHEGGVIHQSLNPSSVLVFQNGKGPTAKLKDFGIGLLLDLAGIKEEDEIIRTFGYMSPEATGILRKPIDERSDIYSLGIIFYQLLTGRLPYEGRDTSTLIHQHIAQKPPLPTKANPSIPQIIEKIILRLIAKDPLDRYQTVNGLIADLKEYVRRKAEGETLDFEIARSDRLKELTYTTRLIGRDKEYNALKDLIDKSKEGSGSLCLVYGDPGVGKSRLVDEMRVYVHSIGGMFVGGRGYQYEVVTPYKVFSEALEAYVDKIKRVSAEQRQSTIKRIKESVGDLGGEVVKLAPSIADLIGEPPALEKLDPEKERIRFLITVTNFVLALGTKDSPLALFIDDLQWGDQGSIELLERVADNVDTLPLTIIACFRDKEVDKYHPLKHALGELREKKIPLKEVLVKPFDIEDTTRIVSEILLEEEKSILPLAKELHQRTNGNVFFVFELLRALVNQGIVYFKDNHYLYDAGKLKEAALPTDIVEIVIKRVGDIPEENRKILSYASVIGKDINLEFLSDLTNIPEEGVLDVLEQGIENQFLVRDITGREAMSFVHESIREAFYVRLPDGERVSLHAQVGQLLEEHYKNNLDPVLYDLAHHFTQAKIEDKTLLYSIQAGKKAQSGYAHDQAIKLYENAREILERQEKTKTDTYRDVLVSLGTAYKSAGRFEDALDAFNTCVSLTPDKDVLHKAEVLSKIGDTLIDQAKIEKAENVLLQALKLLGVRLPKNIFTVLLGISKDSTIWTFHRLFPAIFVRKEYKHDPKGIVVVRLLNRLMNCYYFTNLFKNIHIMYKAQNKAERMGPSRELSHILSIWTVGWSGIPPWPWLAKKEGLRAIQIAHDLNDRAAEGRALAYFADSALNNRTAQECYDLAVKSVELLKGVGEYWDLGVGFVHIAAGAILTGKNIEAVLKETEDMIKIAESANTLQALGWLLYHKTHALAIIGDERLKTEGIKSAERSIELQQKALDKPSMLWSTSMLAFAHLRAGNWDEALKTVEQTKKLISIQSYSGGWIWDLYNICAQVYLESAQYKPNLSKDEKKDYLKKARHSCRRASIKARFFPYMRGWTYKVKGTCQWLEGEKEKAIKTWEKGIAYLREHTKDTYRLATLLLEEASFLLKDNPGDKKASEYLIEAKEIFEQLGAKLDLNRTNKLLRAISPEEEVAETRQTLTLTRHLDSLLSVTKSIGSIFVLEDLLDKIVEQAMKVTGAQRGFLLLYDEENNLQQKVSQGIEEELSTQPFSYENYKLSLNMVQECEKAGTGLFITEDSTTYPQVSGELKECQVRQAMCVPLKAHDKALGIIYLDNRLAGGTFGEDELELMKSFAVQASISIENAYLVSNLVEQERLKQEMELGRQIQLSLLPQKVPQIKGFAIAGLMQPAKEIGGDYFDYITFAGEPNMLGVVVADVTGKGVDAGMVMGMAKAAIFSLAEQNLTTRELIIKLNRHLCKLLNRQKFITMVYAQYSAEEGTLTWSGAGHEYVIVVRNSQEGEHEVEVILTGGIILGVFEKIDEDITQKSITLNKGDKVILYTDGVTEARNAKQEFFKLERLVDVIKHAQSLSAQDLLSYISEQIQKYIGDTPQYDDITLVVMERQ
jgi:serine phosphatase RsbU (regulator of sigma subunit)/serine/threonine protein kinase/tetratricopeptide (TPR) repeat protein